MIYLIDSLSHGGAEQSLLSMTPAILERGVRFEVVYLYERPGLYDRFTETGARVDHLGGERGIGTFSSRMFRLLRQRRPDLLHTTLFESDVAGRIAAGLARVPVTSSIVNVGYSPPIGDPAPLRGLKTARALLLDRTTSRWVSRIHAISEATADFASERLHVATDRIDVIPRGRDAAALGRRTVQRRRKIRQELGIPEEAPLLLFAGRNEEQKGLDILLRSFFGVLSASGGAHLVIAGRPARHAAVTSQLVRLVPSGHVHLLGVRGDVPDLLAACDVFVLPSRWEGLGSVLLEAMALEAPIVASDLPATRELLEDGRTAVLVPPSDVDALTEAILQTLEDTSSALERARRARELFMESHTVEPVVDSMIAFWERALTND